MFLNEVSADGRHFFFWHNEPNSVIIKETKERSDYCFLNPVK